MTSSLDILEHLLGEDIPLSLLFKWYKGHDELITTLMYMYNDQNIDIYKSNKGLNTKIDLWEIEEIARCISQKLNVDEKIENIYLGITAKGTKLVT